MKNEKGSEKEPVKAPEKKLGKWSRFVAAVGNAIGEAKFGR